MDKASIEQKVKSIVSEQLDVPEEKIKNEFSFQERLFSNFCQFYLGLWF